MRKKRSIKRPQRQATSPSRSRQPRAGRSRPALGAGGEIGRDYESGLGRRGRAIGQDAQERADLSEHQTNQSSEGQGMGGMNLGKPGQRGPR